MTEPRTMDVVSSLHKIAGELAQIGVEVHEPPELVARISGASFLLNWIADHLQVELNHAVQRARRMR